MSKRSNQLLYALALLLVAVLAMGKVTSYDTWVHLSLGRWMAENGAIPDTNLLSHTMPDRPTITHQWLFQCALYHGWTTLGAGAMVLLKALAVAGAFALALATARRKGADPATACLVIVLAAAAARFRFTLRPQVAAFLLMALYLYICERWRRGDVRSLLWLLPAQALWAL